MEALEEIKKNKRRVARAYNQKVKAKSFQVGDLIWFGRRCNLLDLRVTSSSSGLQVGKVRTRWLRFVLGILTWWKHCKDSDF
jgi:hypothetical protein